MSASSPNPKYFKDGSGLRPNWRFALKWPRRYAWMVSPRWVKNIRFGWQRWRRRNVPRETLTTIEPLRRVSVPAKEETRDE